MAGWEDFTFPGSSLRRRIKLDETENTIVVESDQLNMTEVLQFNAALRNAERKSSSLWNGEEYVRVASIPLEVVEGWRKEHGIDMLSGDPDMVAKGLSLLDDNDYVKLRTADGRIT